MQCKLNNGLLVVGNFTYKMLMSPTLKTVKILYTDLILVQSTSPGCRESLTGPSEKHNLRYILKSVKRGQPVLHSEFYQAGKVFDPKLLHQATAIGLDRFRGE